MALTPRLDLRQSQQLVMTPQLQQAIKLLQMSNLDLATYVEQELEKNPLLERDDALPGDDDYTASDETPVFEGEGDTDPLKEISISDDAPLSAAENIAIDTDYDNIYTSDAPLDNPPDMIGADAANTGFLAASTGGSSSFSGTDVNLENTLSDDISLRDHLAAQLNLLALSPADKFIASYLIDLVSDTGYLVGNLGEAAESL
ncbi:MAG: hypothetical protein WD185_07710, partial [Sneathiella sp.]